MTPDQLQILAWQQMSVLYWLTSTWQRERR